MIKLILIIGYILNILLNRLMNKKLVENDRYFPVLPITWLLGFIGTFAFLFFWDFENKKTDYKLPKWLANFLGTNWKHKE